MAFVKDKTNNVSRQPGPPRPPFSLLTFFTAPNGAPLFRICHLEAFTESQKTGLANSTVSSVIPQDGCFPVMLKVNGLRESILKPAVSNNTLFPQISRMSLLMIIWKVVPGVKGLTVKTKAESWPPGLHPPTGAMFTMVTVGTCGLVLIMMNLSTVTESQRTGLSKVRIKS